MLNHLKFICVLVGALCFATAEARAQSITLHEGDLYALLEGNAVDTDGLWVANGRKVHAWGHGDDPVGLGRLSGLLWRVAALRLIEMKKLDADKPVVLYIDDFDMDSPFRKSVTLRHLLGGTAGFAIPAFHATTLDFSDTFSRFPINNDWQDYITPISEPGLGARDDIVGEALLAKIILSVWAKDITTTLEDLVFVPLGLEAGVSLPDWPDYTYDAFFAPVMDISISGTGFAAFLSVLSNNLQADGARYLPLILYEALVKGAAWKIHPLGPGRTYGFASGAIDGRRSATILPSPFLRRHAFSEHMGLILFPDAGIVIAERQTGAKVVRDDLLKIARMIAKENIPRTNYFRERKELEALEEVRLRSGYYMLDDMATAWLGEKLNRAKYHSPYISISRAEVTVSMEGALPRTFKRVDARAYQDAGGTMLYVSAGAGGYISIGDQIYRYTGAMGNPYLLISPLWLCLAVLMSAGIYWNSLRGKDWQRFARWSVVGGLCFAIGHFSEIYFYPTQWGIDRSLVPIILWRLLFNIGLMLILTAPMYAWRFGKQNDFHKNVKQMMLGSHVILVAASALVLILMSVSWGLTGALFP